MSFYPNSQMITAEDEAAAAEAPAEQQAHTLLGDAKPDAEPEQSPVPEHIAELRKGSVYDAAKTFEQDISIESAEVEPEQVDALNVELRRMAGDIGFSSPQVREVMAIAKGHSENPPSEEQEAAWRTEASSAIQKQYGERANEALELGRALVQRDPRLAALLDVGRLGNHPRVALALIERAYAEKKAGRL